jgi:hypothetical protein
VSQSVAQGSMRHADGRMTSGVYTHLQLQEIAEGVNRIPDFLNKTNNKKENKKEDEK